MNIASENTESSNALKPMLGDVFFVGSATTVRITNKTHLHSENRKNDTLCSKNFMFPNVDDEPITVLNGKLYRNENEVDTEFICKKCIDVLIKNIT